MKTLTKKSLEEMAKTMYVIPETKLDSIVGAYYNDCFWRCVAYLDSGGSNYNECDAAGYANSYFSSVYGSYSGAYLMSFGSGMVTSDILDYIKMAVKAGTYGNHGLSDYIVMFNTNDISFYSNTNTRHAVVVISANPDGSLNVFDPQIDQFFTISSQEAENTTRAFY